MASVEKLIAAFLACRNTYPYNDFKRILGRLGYREVKRGKTGGSRRRFYNQQIDHILMFHEPHNGEMARGMVKRLREELEAKGLI